jgi:hypothetical protein
VGSASSSRCLRVRRSQAELQAFSWKRIRIR